MTLDFIQRSWPSLFETDVRKVSERNCEDWLIRFQQQYAPTVVNNSIGTLRAVFDEAGVQALKSTLRRGDFLERRVDKLAVPQKALTEQE
jgi:hypothetical protein